MPTSRLRSHLTAALRSEQVRIVAWRLTAAGVSFATNVIAARLIIGAYGLEVFAAITTIATIVTLLPFADLGVGSSMINSAADLHREPSSDARARLRAGQHILVGLALVINAVSVGLLLFDLWGPLLGDGISRLAGFDVGASLVLCLFGIGVALGGGTRVLQGFGRHARVAALGIIGPPLAFAIYFVLVSMRVQPGLVAIASGIAGLGVGAVTCVAAARLLAARGGLRGRAGERVTGGHYRGALQIGVLSMITSAAFLILLQSPRLILSHRADPYELALFALVAPLFIGVHSIIAPAGQYLWPKYRRLSATGELTTAILLRDVLRLACLGVAGGVALVVLGLPAIHLMNHGTIPDGSLAVLVCAAAIVVLEAVHLASGQLLTDRRGFAVQAAIGCVAVVVGLAISWTLAAPLGAVGVLLGPILVLAAVYIPLTGCFALARTRRFRVAPAQPVATGDHR